jgi:hypothetical protein
MERVVRTLRANLPCACFVLVAIVLIAIVVAAIVLTRKTGPNCCPPS